MFQYFDRIREILDIVEQEEKTNIQTAVEKISEAIINKRSIFAFGASHAGILTQELFYRAGGLININPIFARELMLDTEPVTHTSRMERLIGYGTVLAEKTPFSEGDVLIIHSVSGRNPVAIDLAFTARLKGVTIIAITNVTYSKSASSRHPLGKNLFEISDIVIDNHGDIGDATCVIEGVPQKVAPSSTVIGATIVNTIVVEVVKRLAEQGISPVPIFYSANLDGGDELNKKLFEEYKETIHYRFDY